MPTFSVLSHTILPLPAPLFCNIYSNCTSILFNQWCLPVEHKHHGKYLVTWSFSACLSRCSTNICWKNEWINELAFEHLPCDSFPHFAFLMKVVFFVLFPLNSLPRGAHLWALTYSIFQVNSAALSSMYITFVFFIISFP